MSVTAASRLSFFSNVGASRLPVFSRNATVPRFEERTDEADPFSSIGVGRDSSVPTLADVEGDGDLDLVVVLREGQVWKMRYFEYVGFTGQPLFVRRICMCNGSMTLHEHEEPLPLFA